MSFEITLLIFIINLFLNFDPVGKQNLVKVLTKCMLETKVSYIRVIIEFTSIILIGTIL